MSSILFVCTANICRSPMAAALFADAVRDLPGVGEWRVESAGIWTRNGQPACPGALAAMRSRGLDIASHHSRVVTADLLSPFSLILTMEASQQEALRAEFPQIANRVFLLAEMAGARRDVEDPYGGDLQDYEATAAELMLLITGGMERIVALAQTNPGEDAPA